MYENKDQNFTFIQTLICIVLMFLFTIFFFLFVGICKVEASSFNKNLYWDTPTWIQYYSGEPFATNGSTIAGQNVLQACNKTSYCLASDGFPSYALIGYNITDNSTDSTITAFQNGDKFKFQVTLDYMLNSNAINHFIDFDFKITSGSAVYNAYCDSGEDLNIVYVEQDERYQINYICDVFNVDRPIRYFMFQLHSTNDLFYSVGVLENFSVIVTPLDAGDIIANQNQNAQDIMNNMDENTDKVVDAVEGEDLEDTTPVDKTKEEEYKEAENALLNENNLNLLNDIDISLDSNSNIFIWNMVTSIINSHALIFGFVITILSLGVLKLVLNR